jgi:hypothetical protein
LHLDHRFVHHANGTRASMKDKRGPWPLRCGEADIVALSRSDE